MILNSSIYSRTCVCVCEREGEQELFPNSKAGDKIFEIDAGSSSKGKS